MKHYKKLNQAQTETVEAWSKGEQPKQLSQTDRRAQLIEEAKEVKRIKVAIEVRRS